MAKRAKNEPDGVIDKAETEIGDEKNAEKVEEKPKKSQADEILEAMMDGRKAGTKYPVHCAHDEIVALHKLRPHPKNPNKHPQRQIQILSRAIQVNGWRAPITVSTRSGLIVRGHGRLAAGMLAGEEFGPVDFQDYESDELEKADLVADNRIAELANMDKDAERVLMKELAEANFEIEVAGFTEAEFDKLFRIENALKEDAAPTFPITPRTNEAYDFVMVFTTSETDKLFLFTLLGIETELSYKRSKKVGLGRVVTFKKFMEKLHENRNSINVARGNDDDAQAV